MKKEREVLANLQASPVEDSGLEQGTLAIVRQRIMGYVKSRHPQLGEDIAQECMLLLHRRYGHLKELKDLVPVGITIAKYKIKEKTRDLHETRIQQMDEGFDRADARQKSGEQIMIEAAAVQRLQAGIRQLGPGCQELLKMMLQRKRTEEMCQVLGITSGTLHTRLCRCRQKLVGVMGWAR